MLEGKKVALERCERQTEKLHAATALSLATPPTQVAAAAAAAASSDDRRARVPRGNVAAVALWKVGCVSACAAAAWDETMMRTRGGSQCESARRSDTIASVRSLLNSRLSVELAACSLVPWRAPTTNTVRCWRLVAYALALVCALLADLPFVSVRPVDYLFKVVLIGDAGVG